MSLLARAARRGAGVGGWTRGWLAPSRVVAACSAAVEADVAPRAYDPLDGGLNHRHHVNVGGGGTAMMIVRGFATSRIQRPDVPASQTQTRDEAAELRAVAQLKDEIRELLQHARDNESRFGQLRIRWLCDEYKSRFGKDLVQTSGQVLRTNSTKVTDSLVRSLMKREGIFHTKSMGVGRARQRVYNLTELLRSEHFADVVDVYPRGDGMHLFVPAGSPAPLPYLPPPAYEDVAASWLQALPSGKRAKLEAALSAAATPH
jgi:hypothetical protein